MKYLINISDYALLDEEFAAPCGQSRVGVSVTPIVLDYLRGFAMNARVQATIRELYGRMQELVSTNWEPSLDASHEVADFALKGLEARLAELPPAHQDVVRYMLYEELLAKASEFQTLVDILSDQIPVDDDTLLNRFEQHMNSVLG